MHNFDDIEMSREEEASPQVADKYQFQKQRLIFNMTRNPLVCSAAEKWLMSFVGGMSKQTFMAQIAKLDSDDEVAIRQLENSVGKRSIAKIRTALPSLPLVGDTVQMLASGILFIAVCGKEKPLQSFIRSTYQTLKSLGRTYVLDLNELRLEWVDKFQKGKSPEMITRSKEAEFLIIVGFETPLDLPFYIGDTLNTIRRYRVEHGYPIISTFARFREKEKFFEYFKKYRVN